jgi:hypothetical protein
MFKRKQDFEINLSEEDQKYINETLSKVFDSKKFDRSLFIYFYLVYFGGKVYGNPKHFNIPNGFYKAIDKSVEEFKKEMGSIAKV